jgi:hypothetical protein
MTNQLDRTAAPDPGPGVDARPGHMKAVCGSLPLVERAAIERPDGRRPAATAPVRLCPAAGRRGMEPGHRCPRSDVAVRTEADA